MRLPAESRAAHPFGRARGPLRPLRLCSLTVDPARRLADALIEKLGGDSLAEMKPRFDQLRQARLADLIMDNVKWRF